MPEKKQRCKGPQAAMRRRRAASLAESTSRKRRALKYLVHQCLGGGEHSRDSLALGRALVALPAAARAGADCQADDDHWSPYGTADPAPH